MRLTTDMLAAAYDLLRATPPFDGWNLPDSDEVRFKVLRTSANFGDCSQDDKGWVIRLSDKLHPRLTGAITTMAHEMIHIHLDETACQSRHARLRSDSATHGPGFRACAVKVLKQFPEFDPATF